MSIRTQRSLQALILAALGVFLLEKILSGTLFWYINQRFMLLVLAAGVGLLALAQIVFQSLRPRPKPHNPVEDDHHPHEHHAGHAHGTLPVWGLVVVALPVLLGVLIPARPLGTSAIANKGVDSLPPGEAAASLRTAGT